MFQVQNIQILKCHVLISSNLDLNSSQSSFLGTKKLLQIKCKFFKICCLSRWNMYYIEQHIEESFKATFYNEWLASTTISYSINVVSNI